MKFDRGMGKAVSRGRTGDAPLPHELAALGRRILSARRLREKFFAGDLFAEPGWEMLLSLYEANASGHRLTSTNLCRASNAPSTTALRWIENLAELGLVRRRKNPLDARVVFIELEPHANVAIASYLCDFWVLMYGPA
jgi:DNA-binding MarR family transcriptional regulator